MALALQTELDVIDFSLCPVPANLQPGKYYRLTGLSQGSLGNYSIIAAANTATQFSNDVRVFPVSAPANDSGWQGTFDFDTCVLTYVRDNKHNQVAGAVNISVFPWFPANPARVANNVVQATATLDLGGNAYLGQFENNHVLTTSTLTVSGPALLSSDLFINDNIWKRVSFNLSTAIVVRLVISANNFLEANSLVVSGIDNIGDVFIANNVVSNNGSIEFGNVGTASIVDNTIDGGFLQSIPPLGTTHTFQENVVTHNANIQLLNADDAVVVTGNWIGGLVYTATFGGTVSITNNVLGPASELQLFSADLNGGSISLASNAIFGTATLTNTAVEVALTLSGSTILYSGNTGAFADFEYTTLVGSTGTHEIKQLTQLAGSRLRITTDSGPASLSAITLAQNGRLVCYGAQNGASITNVYVENGELDYAGFNMDNIRLQGTSSALIADIADSKKDGYAGALP